MRPTGGAILVAAALAAGCAAPTGEDDVVAEARQAVVGGRLSPSAEDYAVLLETFRGPDGSLRRWRCSGTLVDPRIVVTARHCLLATAPTSFVCQTNGELAPGSPPIDPTLVSPGHVRVWGGATRVEEGAGSVDAGYDPALRTDTIGWAQAIFTTALDNICRDDIAFVVLDHPLALPIAPIRPISVAFSDQLTLLGWGKTGDESAAPEARYARDGIAVTEIGPGVVPINSFGFGARTGCFGDSGGGLVDKNGLLVGAYSRIDLGSCDSPNGRNLGTAVAPFRGLGERAFEAVGSPSPWAVLATPPDDAGPPPDAASGEPAADPPAEEMIPPLRTSDGGCGMSPRRDGPFVALFLLATLLVRRFREIGFTR